MFQTLWQFCKIKKRKEISLKCVWKAFMKTKLFNFYWELPTATKFGLHSFTFFKFICVFFFIHTANKLKKQTNKWPNIPKKSNKFIKKENSLFPFLVSKVIFRGSHTIWVFNNCSFVVSFCMDLLILKKSDQLFFNLSVCSKETVLVPVYLWDA